MPVPTALPPSPCRFVCLPRLRAIGGASSGQGGARKVVGQRGRGWGRGRGCAGSACQARSARVGRVGAGPPRALAACSAAPPTPVSCRSPWFFRCCFVSLLLLLCIFPEPSGEPHETPPLPRPGPSPQPRPMLYSVGFHAPSLGRGWGAPHPTGSGGVGVPGTEASALLEVSARLP